MVRKITRNLALSELLVEAVKVRASRPVVAGYENGQYKVAVPSKDDVRISLSKEIALMVAYNLKMELRGSSVSPVLLEQCQTPDDICEVYIAINKTAIGVEGYKVEKDKNGLIQVVFGLDDDGKMSVLPKRDLTKKNERPYDSLSVDQLAALTQIQPVSDKMQDKK